MPEPTLMRTATDTAVQIASPEPRTLFRLKTWLPEYVNGAALMLAGQDLPSRVGETRGAATHVLCTAPGEWLIVSRDLFPLALRQELESELPEAGFALVDVTAGLARLEVRGPAARDVLARSCGLDFHPRHFPAGRCARTRFAQIPVAIDCLDDPQRFELFFARSYLHYLRSWLIDSAASF